MEFVYAEGMADMNQKMKKLVPSYQTQTEISDSVNDQSTISSLGRTNRIFPKSKTSFTVNSVFNRQSFDTKNAFIQNKNIGFTPNAMKGNGLNDSFLIQKKPLSNKEIPKEFRDIFTKNKK